MKLDLYDTYGKRFIVQLEYYSHIDKAAIFLSYIFNRKKKVDVVAKPGTYLFPVRRSRDFLRCADDGSWRRRGDLVVACCSSV